MNKETELALKMNRLVHDDFQEHGEVSHDIGLRLLELVKDAQSQWIPVDSKSIKRLAEGYANNIFTEMHYDRKYAVPIIAGQIHDAITDYIELKRISASLEQGEE